MASKIKVISSITANGLEEEVNEFLLKGNGLSIIDIKYSTHHNGSATSYYSVCIIYNEKKL